MERSPRIKRMQIQIHRERIVVLKLPLREAAARGRRFLEENGDWICRTLARQPRILSLREHLQRHPRLSLAGHWHGLEWTPEGKGIGYRVEEERRRVCLSRSGAGEREMVTLLRRIAREFLPPRLLELARLHGLKAHGVTIRDQKSRWGSCSETGGISLNWRLILLSPVLQDHVLLHELAHLNHFDHSRAFHAFLESLDPQSLRNARELDAAAARIIHLGRDGS